MRLLEYKLTVPASVTTMDRYYHLMFRAELPYVDSSGNITDDHMKYVNKHNLALRLERLSKQHPEVMWEIKTESQQVFISSWTARNGRVTRVNDRLNNDGGSKLAA
jgi:hypothetical protein